MTKGTLPTRTLSANALSTRAASYCDLYIDVSAYLDLILFLACFGFVLCFGSITFVVVHCIVQILQAAIAFYLFDILYYFIYEEKSTTFFVALISEILSSRLELKSFILLLCILFSIHYSIKEIASILCEKLLGPKTTIIVDCPKHPMQSPQLTQLADEMARIRPTKWAKSFMTINITSPKDPKPKTIMLKETKPKDPEPTIPKPSTSNPTTPSDPSFASHGNRYMRHPWGVIDYHIYLTHVENRRDNLRREKECYILENTGFRQALHYKPLLDNVLAHTNPTVVFVSLPVPDAQNESSIASLVLGFDRQSRCLQGWFFEPKSPIENYADLWKVWSQGEGQLVIDIPIDRFLAIVRYTMQHQIEILELGLLHHHALTTHPFQAGLDMVITVQFLQFIDDFAELVSEKPQEIREIFMPFQDELREMLAAGSRDSWFAVRDGHSIDQYRQRQLKKVVASGLFYGQKKLVPRGEVEPTETPKVSRQVRVISGHSSRWSWSKLRVRFLVSAMFVVCCCTVLDRERILCVGMF
ncbi:hypothetical protein N7517_009113 [Penicillium concentricum]|uniref:Uncharacterized protein n=1 Tax=Penicillium concentricum TaxID=293559 RepID=A0A9W9UWG2_9EURO|nr:uncharacterized protein N7517_009113 [Penicillium concentricum]KAJ5359922.1 hypothetical protein N7517_009113 [Penicillium concentricum]